MNTRADLDRVVTYLKDNPFTVKPDEPECSVLERLKERSELREYVARQILKLNRLAVVDNESDID